MITLSAVLDAASRAAVAADDLGALRCAWERAGVAETFGVLDGWDLRPTIAERLVQAYGAAAHQVVARNPYRPVEEIDGYGWQTAERVATHLHLEEDDPRRVCAGLAEAVRRGTTADGHTWMTYPTAVLQTADLLGLETDLIEVVLAEAQDDESAGGIVREEMRVWPRTLHVAEQLIAAGVDRLLTAVPLCPQAPARPAASVLSPEQWQAVVRALTCPISIITGGPGMGKTTVIRTVVDLAASLHLPVTLLAPTGKAALRMTEATGAPASTLHSALRLEPGSLEPRLEDPLAGIVVIDEASMIDSLTAAALFTALGAVHLVLVGDPDQLPSVGPGAVLRDLLAVGCCPRTHLTHCYRNDAGVAINAAHVRAGEPLEQRPDCWQMGLESQDAAIERVVDLLTGTLPERGWSRHDALILTATNDLRMTLNDRLQALFNPRGAVVYQGRTNDRTYLLRVGDPVMVTKNSRTLGVFNGQRGIVQGLQGKHLLVDLDEQVVLFGIEDRKHLQLAYAITGHKAQGSEAPVVIALVFRGRVASKEWLYTVMTRAQEQCYLLGDTDEMQRCVRRPTLLDRHTGLVEQIEARVG